MISLAQVIFEQDYSLDLMLHRGLLLEQFMEEFSKTTKNNKHD